MPRLIYLCYGLGSIAAVGVCAIIFLQLFKSAFLFLLSSYLSSSILLFYATVKRLQDINVCGINAFLMFVPGIKQLLFFYLLFPRGTSGDNAYGIDPLLYSKIKPVIGRK
jgi:uncharacterized membrane protein YhaH (DUF805 family)